MALLTAAIRKKMPAKEFAGPGKSFPMPDKEHAKLAEEFVGRSEAAGNVTPMQAAVIRRKAKTKLAV